MNLFSLDFDGKTKLSLWRLYARLADAFVVGKAYSTFVDPDVLPTTLDFNGPSGSTAVQQWLARAIVPLGAGWTLAGGIEDSQADHRAGRRGFGVRTDARRPDVAAHLRFDSERGHVQVSGLSRRIDVTSTTVVATTERTFDASGISISGSLATFGDDSVVAQYTTGKGIGRYFNDSVSATGMGLGADDRLDLIRSSGATLYYQHFWTSGLDDGRRREHAVGERCRDAPAGRASPPCLRVGEPHPPAAADASRRGGNALGKRDARRRRHRDERAAAAIGALSRPVS